MALEALVVVDGDGIGLIEVEVVCARFVDSAVVDAIDEAVVVGVSGEVRKLFAVLVLDALFSALRRRWRSAIAAVGFGCLRYATIFLHQVGNPLPVFQIV